MKKISLVLATCMIIACSKKQQTPPPVVTVPDQYGTLIFKSVFRYTTKNILVYHFLGFNSNSYNLHLNDDPWNYANNSTGEKSWNTHDSLGNIMIDTIKVNITYYHYWLNRVSAGKGNQTIGGTTPYNGTYPDLDCMYHWGPLNMQANQIITITDTIYW